MYICVYKVWSGCHSLCNSLVIWQLCRQTDRRQTDRPIDRWPTDRQMTDRRLSSIHKSSCLQSGQWMKEVQYIPQVYLHVLYGFGPWQLWVYHRQVCCVSASHPSLPGSGQCASVQTLQPETSVRPSSNQQYTENTVGQKLPSVLVCVMAIK